MQGQVYITLFIIAQAATGNSLVVFAVFGFVIVAICAAFGVGGWFLLAMLRRERERNHELAGAMVEAMTAQTLILENHEKAQHGVKHEVTRTHDRLNALANEIRRLQEVVVK